jgi:hypothetical protein
MADLIPLDQAAKDFGIGRNTLFRHLQIGNLKRYKGGIGDRRTYIDRRELKRLLKPQEAKN